MKLPGHELIPTRDSLLSRLRDWEDHDSWKEFFDTYWRLIYSFAIRSGLTDAEAQDVVQETIIGVAKGIHTFKRDKSLGSFKGWLYNLTRWRIADQMRKRPPGMPERRRKKTGTGSSAVDIEQVVDGAIPSAEELWDKGWQEGLFEAALARVKQRVKEEHYQIFHFSTFKGWRASKVAAALGVSTAQVYLVKHRVSAIVKKEVRILEKGLPVPDGSG